MSRRRLPHLHLVPTAGHDPSTVPVDEQTARRDASHWFVRLREESGDEALKAGFEAWLHAHPLHAEAWESMRGTMQAVGRAPAALRDWPALEAGEHRHEATPPVPVRFRHPLRYALAAAAALCAFAVTLPTLRLHLRADHVTSTGRVEQIRLSDGSMVQLGPDSAIAIDYTGGARHVRLLSGQALFDVTPDESRPFWVVAGDVTTTVLGTSFDVRMIGDATSVAVQRGQVRVETRGATPASSQELRAGQWVHIDPDRGAEAGSIDPDLVGGWLNGEAVAENRSIASIVEEVRPWYRGRIVVTDASLANRPVTGIYNLRDPAQALTLLVEPYGGQVRRVTPWLLVVSGP